MNQGWREVFVDRMELKGCKLTLQHKVFFPAAERGWRHAGTGLGLGLVIGGRSLGLEAMDLASTCGQAPNAFICVSGVAPLQTPNAFICVSPNAFICVSPNASAESATEVASLANLCSRFAAGSRSFVDPGRDQSSGLEHRNHVSLQLMASHASNQSRAHPIAKTSGMRPFGDPSVKITAAQERVTKLESALAALDGVEGPEVDSLRTALKRAKEVKLLPLDVQVKECEGFLSRARAHLTELDAKRAMVSANIQDAERRLETMKIQQQSAPPPPPQDARFRIAAVTRDCCSVEGSVASDQADSDIGMSLFQASMQEGRFCSKLFGGVAGVDQRTTSRSPRRNGGREARRGGEDQRHHVLGGSAVATRSCSWSYAVPW